MPRAFLITHRRYNSEEREQRAASPEGAVHEAEAKDCTKSCAASDSECPEELYNLTQLAEVSLAAAAGHLLHLEPAQPYSHKLFDRIQRVKDGEFSLLSRSVSSCTAGLVDGHRCPDCGKRYSTSSNLARHRQTHRSLADKKARRCPHCGKVYVSMPAYSMHVRTHSQACRCHYCGKCFSRPWLLQGHIRTHTGEKPFKCNVCGKAFADKSNLRAHIQTHSNTKPHVCTRCGKAFALKSYLYKHEESSCMRLRSSSPSQHLHQTGVELGSTVAEQQQQRTSVISPNPTYVEALDFSSKRGKGNIINNNNSCNKNNNTISGGSSGGGNGGKAMLVTQLCT